MPTRCTLDLPRGTHFHRAHLPKPNGMCAIARLAYDLNPSLPSHEPATRELLSMREPEEVSEREGQSVHNHIVNK